MAEEQPDWLAVVLKEAEEKTDANPAFQPPPVNQIENNYLSISEEERERKFRFWNNIIITIIILQIIALIFVMFW